jgi:hypothetical protein
VEDEMVEWSYLAYRRREECKFASLSRSAAQLFCVNPNYWIFTASPVIA